MPRNRVFVETVASRALDGVVEDEASKSTAAWKGAALTPHLSRSDEESEGD